ncbi:hypothetical protein BDF19DRAFT_446065 [Syncephalis fuscata]|nr:hypothetical protein BDF19DRAFT_446065 [Syncephalis fuscata]
MTVFQTTFFYALLLLLVFCCFGGSGSSNNGAMALTAQYPEGVSLQHLTRRQVPVDKCLANHYCSPGNETIFGVDSTINIAWNTTSPFFTQPVARNVSILLSLEDIATRESIWNKTVENSQSGTNVTDLVVTNDMLNSRAYRLLRLVIRQANNTNIKQQPADLRITLAAAAEETSMTNEQANTANSRSHLVPIVAACTVGGIVACLAIICIVVSLVRRYRRRKHSVAATNNNMPNEKASQFVIPTIMVSPPTIRSRMRASIVSSLGGQGRRASTVSNFSNITRPPSAVLTTSSPSYKRMSSPYSDKQPFLNQRPGSPSI